MNNIVLSMKIKVLTQLMFLIEYLSIMYSSEPHLE